MELQKMWVSLMLKSDGFTSGLNAAERQVQGWGGRLQSTIGGGLGRLAGIGQAAFLGVGAAAVGGFGLAMNSAIQMNSSLETSTLQFATLMGDADLAAGHVKALFEFAGRTPYETQPIIDASLKLQTFGGEALNTMGNLTLVGDAAAAVGAPIDEVAFWVGRLYSNLQGGQPFGEAAMRLQELGIMAPTARTELEGMQAAGLSGSEIFAAFQGQLGAFSGAMEAQAGTWQGLSSTIKDQLGLLTAEALKPFFDLAKEGLAGLAEWLSSPEIQAAITTFATNVRTLAENMKVFITEQLVPFIQDHGPQIKAVLIALGIVIMASLIPAVVSLVISMAPIILVVGAIVAAVWLLSTAWENNWGGIRDKTKAVWDFLKPIFEVIVEWVGNKIRADMEQLRAFWVDVAWPAIQRVIEIVWPVVQRIFQAIRDFITETLIPTIRTLYEKWTQEWWPTIQTVLENVWTIIRGIFEEIGRWVNENIVPWIEFLKKVWVEQVWPAIQTKIEEAWAIIEPIWEAIRKWAAETIPPILETLKGVFETVMGGISSAIQPVKDLWDRFVDAVSGFWDWISNKVFNFNISIPDLPSWAVPGSPLPIHTAWRDFADDMPGIGDRVASGIELIRDALDFPDPVQQMNDILGGMLGIGGSIGGIAGGFARRFEQTVTEPMRRKIDELSGVVSAASPIFASVFRDQNLKFLDDTSQTSLNQLLVLRGRLAERIRDYQLRGVHEAAFLYELQSLNRVNQAIDAFRLRNDINAEYVQQQEKLLALEKARADLDFLESQMDLLNLVKANLDKLPAGILDGLQFGLAADSGKLMDTMVEIMQRLVRSASAELQVRSPSRVFENMGRMVNAGFAEGLEDTRSIERSLEKGLGAAMGYGREVAGGGKRTTVYGGVHVNWVSDEEPALEELEVLSR